MEYMITHYQISPLVHGIRKCRFIYALDDGTITVVCVNGRKKMQDFLINTDAVELDETVSIYEKANELRRLLGRKAESVPQAEAEE